MLFIFVCLFVFTTLCLYCPDNVVDWNTCAEVRSRGPGQFWTPDSRVRGHARYPFGQRDILLAKRPGRMIDEVWQECHCHIRFFLKCYFPSYFLFPYYLFSFILFVILFLIVGSDIDRCNWWLGNWLFLSWFAACGVSLLSVHLVSGRERDNASSTHSFTSLLHRHKNCHNSLNCWQNIFNVVQDLPNFNCDAQVLFSEPY